MEAAPTVTAVTVEPGVGSSQLGRRLERVQIVGRHRPLRLGEVQGAIGGHLDVLIVGNHLECHCDLHFCTFLFKNFSHVSVRFKRSTSLQPMALRWCHSAAARFGRHRQNPVKASLLKM